MNKHNNTNLGMATFELLISLALIIVLITSILPVIAGQQNILVGSITNQEALYKARDLLLSIVSDSKNNFDSVESIPLVIDGVYTKSLNVDDISLFEKKITSQIVWNNGLSKVELVTLITNPSAVILSNTCSYSIAGDWSQPQKRVYELGNDILRETDNDFKITSLKIFDKKLFITSNNVSMNNDSTFFIQDIANPNITPLSLGHFDNSPNISEGLNDVFIADKNYAFVANAYDSSSGDCIEDYNCAQLQVIDISNSLGPYIVRNFKIDSRATSGNLANGRSLFYKNGIVFIGLSNATNGEELFLIDVGAVSGSPINPVLMSGIEVGSGVNDIYVKGHYLYIASGSDSELVVFDISNPYSPEQVGDFNALAGNANNGNGKSIKIMGDNLYLGRTLLNGNEFYILDNNNPESLSDLGSENIQNGLNNTSVNSIIIKDYLAFLATNEDLKILRVDNPSSILEYAPPIGFLDESVNYHGVDSDCQGDHIFIGSYDDDGKSYITVINATE